LPCLLHAGGSLKDPDCKRLEHQGKTAMWFGPRNFARLDTALRTIRAWHTSNQNCLKLHGVQMSPLPLWGMILQGRCHTARTTAEGISGRFQPYPNLHIGQIQIHVCDSPRIVQAQ
jgi:hypothetical protein